MPIVAVIPALLALLTQASPFLTSASIIGTVIKTVAEIAPVAIQTYKDVAPSIKGVINALKENPNTTAQQLDELDAISAKVDADFEEAVKNQD